MAWSCEQWPTLHAACPFPAAVLSAVYFSDNLTHKMNKSNPMRNYPCTAPLRHRGGERELTQASVGPLKCEGVPKHGATIFKKSLNLPKPRYSFLATIAAALRPSH